LLLQLDPVDLAGAEPRQWFGREDHPRRGLEGREPALEESAKLCLGNAASLAAMEDCYRDFPEPFIHDAENCRLGDAFAIVEGCLDFRGRDILPSADDDVFLAIDDEQIALV